MLWTAVDFWIVLGGALAGLACALPGTLLVLRKMSMMGDAISHAVLPGIVLAYFVSRTRAGPGMLIGAVLAGLTAALLTQWLQRKGNVEEGASMGIIFTLMFAAGILLLESPAFGRFVNLDLDCVLFGAVEFLPLAARAPFPPYAPWPVVFLFLVFLGNLALVGLLIKEFQLCCFDTDHAHALGLRPQRMHLLLMVMTAVTSVFAFEVVGSILVVAMLIVPAACARLYTDRLGTTFALACGFAVLFAVSGHWAATEIPHWFGAVDTSSAGSMAAAGGVFFLASAMLSPRYGVLFLRRHRHRLARQTQAEDFLGRLYRAEELERAPGVPLAAAEIKRLPRRDRMSLRDLLRQGYIDVRRGQVELTHAGFRAGAELLRRHRLWEGYLLENTATPRDHLHLSAEQLEHVTPPRLREQLAEALGDPRLDPSGHRIPSTDLVGGETLQDEPPGSSNAAS